MDGLLLVRVATAFVVDASLAVLCGLALAEQWLARSVAPASRDGMWKGGTKSVRACMKVSAALLCVGSCWQIILLAMTFSGESGLGAVLAMMPDVFGTHAGGVLLAACGVAGVLFAVSWLAQGQVRSGVSGLLLLSFTVLHGAVGHAAVDGVFSWAEGWQWAHLFGMALWSGGVLVSGLLVVPRMVDARNVRRYLERLSAVSTWCVAVVLLSGVVKGYRVGGGITMLRSSDWGHVLVLKVIAVTLTVGLGARNRWLLRSSSPGDGAMMRSVTLTLRAESVCMAGVLLLSAWLANSALPME